MTTVVDPFKQRTYGIKKSLEEKEEKIKMLQDQNKRYYPFNRNGRVDEWGAVIKHQAEQYEVEQQLLAQQQQYQKKHYAEQLDKDLERKKLEKQLNSQTVESEAMQIHQRKYIQEQRVQAVRSQEQQMKMEVVSLNKKQIEEQQRKLALERELELEEGRKQREIIEQNEAINKKLEALKRETFAAQMKYDLEQKFKTKQTNQLMQQAEKEEVVLLNKDYEQKQIQREMEYKQRFQRFNDLERQKLAAFKKSLSLIGDQQQRNVQNPLTYDNASLFKKLHEQDQSQQNWRLQAYSSVNNVLKQQMLDKEAQKMIDRKMIERENEHIKSKLQEQLMTEDKLKEERKRQQMMYKGILDSQISFVKEVDQSYGNMTNVEKKLNKDDLESYKSYDKTQHALMPGVQLHKYSPSQQKDANTIPKPAAQRQSLNKSFDVNNGMYYALNQQEQSLNNIKQNASREPTQDKMQRERSITLRAAGSNIFY